MKITKVSTLTGKTHTLNLDITQEQLDEYNSPNHRDIKEIMPNLFPIERVFLITGITSEECK